MKNFYLLIFLLIPMTSQAAYNAIYSTVDSGNYSSADAACVAMGNEAIAQGLTTIEVIGTTAEPTATTAPACQGTPSYKVLGAVYLNLEICTSSDPVTGQCLTACDDGLPYDIPGYSGCDRPLLKVCTDGSYVLKGDSCSVVCGDYNSCFAFALSTNPCDLNNPNDLFSFNYVSPNNFESTCTLIDSGSVDNTANGGNADGNIDNDPNSTPTTSVANLDLTSFTSSIDDVLSDNFSNIENAIRTQTTNDVSNTADITNSITSLDTSLSGSLSSIAASNAGILGELQNQSTPSTGPCDASQANYLDCLQITGLPALSTPDSIDTSTAGFYGRISASNIVSAFSNVSNMFDTSNGTCSPLSITLPYPISETVTTTLFCDLLVSNAAILSSIMIIIWSFVGFRIIVSA